MARSAPVRSAGNLPADLTSFVGRRHEISTVKRLIRENRLVTLTGGAGVGKTRLALRVAGQLGHAFPDGVWLVELAALDDDRFLVQTVADAVGVRDQSTRAPLDVLAEFLADKELLLVMDNCEHVVDTCAKVVNDLLRHVPRLRVLATSRQVLGVTGERLFGVRPLPVPETEGPQPGHPAARTEAMRLFAERAAVARPGFTVNAGNRAAVAQLCRRLEGIPLAIELAAVRVRAMPLDQILARLEDYYFEILDAGSRVAVSRPQTLRAAIDWSFNLCSAQEQRLWARASVFSGGFDLETAESVGSGAGIAGADVLELIAGLVDKSVLVRSAAAGVARYRMLEAIREYGARRLACSGEATTVRARHRDHFGELARRAERDLLGPGELEGFTRLWRDHANLRTALEFCLTEPEQARAGLEIAGSLWHYWTVSGRHREGRRWLDRALPLAPWPSPARAKALWVSGSLALLQNDSAAARSRVDQCRVLAEQLGDDRALAHAIRVSAVDALIHDDLRHAVTLFDEALARMRALDDRTGTWICLAQMTLPCAILGDADRVRACGEQSAELVSTVGAPTARAWTLGANGLGQWLVGNQQRGVQLVRESLRVVPSHIDPWGVAHCLEVLAWAAATRRAPERAARLLGTAHVVWSFTAMPPARLRYLAPEHALCEQRARAALGERFGKLFDEGARLTIDEAIAYALADDP